MLKVNVEKVLQKYRACQEAREGVVAECDKVAKGIGAERGYSAELVEKLKDFLLVNAYQDTLAECDKQFDFWKQFVDDVEDVVVPEVEEVAEPTVHTADAVVSASQLADLFKRE